MRMRNILLFDIDQTTIRLFEEIVENSFRACRFLNYVPGNHALNICLETKPSIILIDLVTSGIHAANMCRAIKKSNKLRNIPLIGLSENKREGHSHYLEDGPDFIIYKPLDEDECLALLKMCLRLSDLEQLVPARYQEMNNMLIEKEAELINFTRESKRTEELLRIERDFANQVLNAMGQGLTITNSDGFFQYINPAFSRMMGYEPDELLGKNPRDVTLAEDHPVLDEARQTRKKGRSSSYETRIMHKDGSSVSVMVTGVPYYKAGEVAGTIAVITDISNLKRTENRLTSLSDDYEQVLNGTQAAIFLVKVSEDHTFRYILNNAFHQKHTGISLEMIVGKTPEQLVGEQTGKLLSKNYRRCLNAKQIITYEEELHLPAGKKTWFTSLSPVIKDGKVVCIVGSSFDITTRRQPDTSATQTQVR